MQTLPAQTNGDGGASVAVRQSADASSDGVYGIDRLAFRVNALELLCTVPNINAEFDLSSSPYNRFSLSLTAKYNPQTRHSTAPSLVFNMFELRPEFRWWFRISPKYGRTAKERAYFLGAYLHGGTYCIKPGTYGIQGPLWGVGALFGYDFPLYTYRRFAVDFELGIAAGLGMTSYDAFTMNRAGSDYVLVPERSRGMHLCPFPVVSELKACFVFRTLSIKDKYRKVDAQKMIQRQERAEQKQLEKENLRQTRIEAAEKKAAEKALKQEAKEKKSAKKAAKAQNGGAEK